MKQRSRKYLFLAGGLFAAFALWTAAISLVDVREIGPLGSAVGFATVNRCVHDLTGVHMRLYAVTDWLGLVPVGAAFGFAVLGLVQWIRRKRLQKVDRSLLVLGAFYLAVMAVYICFEQCKINFRPVLINGILEASYPSSTTVLVLTVMPTTALQLRERLKNGVFWRLAVFATTAFSVCVVMGRLISGVHWFSDIVGGILISAALVMLYRSATE